MFKRKKDELFINMISKQRKEKIRKTGKCQLPYDMLRRYDTASNRL